MERHHVAGRRNCPITVPIPANAHKSRLTEDQYQWPKETLENPNGSPLRRAAGCIRGCVDLILWLMESMMEWVAELLERLDEYLHGKFGEEWWVGTEIERAVPSRWRNAHAK
jgi:hypothetical protein